MAFHPFFIHFSEPHSSNNVSDLHAILKSFSTQMLRSPCGQLVPCGLESHRTFHEYQTHHYSHQCNYLRLPPVWTVTILPNHRQAFILMFIIMHPLSSVVMMRSRKIGSDRLIPKNHLDAPKRADFSSSVSSLCTYLADTCDKPRSAVKTRSAADLLQLALTAT